VEYGLQQEIVGKRILFMAKRNLFFTKALFFLMGYWLFAQAPALAISSLHRTLENSNSPMTSVSLDSSVPEHIGTWTDYSYDDWVIAPGNWKFNPYDDVPVLDSNSSSDVFSPEVEYRKAFLFKSIQEERRTIDFQRQQTGTQVDIEDNLLPDGHMQTYQVVRDQAWRDRAIHESEENIKRYQEELKNLH
jgi:hypothetical protein